MNIACPASLTTVADDIANLLTSGASGTALLAELNNRFAQSSRAEVYFGVAMAVSLLESERVGLLYDLSVAEGRLAALARGCANA